MTLWPAWVLVLGALGYTNKDEISGIIFTSDGQKITDLTAFEQYAHEQFDRIDTERGFDKAQLREELKAAIDALKAQSQSGDQNLRNTVRDNRKKIKDIELLVQ
ncbi:MAG: hypothetical protein ACR2PH_15675 [Desulfobulbia bacterium]